MPLPELLQQLVEKKLAAYCLARAPEHLHDQVRIGYRFRGQTVTLYESRTTFMKPERWVENAIAQFRFDPETKSWSLYCADRNLRWHLYEGLEPQRNFEILLTEVDRDPTGIFW